MENKRKSPNPDSREQQTPDHDSTGGVDPSGSYVGAVPQAARTPDETTADDPVSTQGDVREDRLPSNASALPADDPDAGEQRKKAYEKGATIVSRI